MIPYTQAKRLTFKEVSGGGTSLTYQSLIMKTLPSTLDYSVGDLLSFDGMELYGIYSDGTDTFMKDVTDLATSSIAEGTEITENTPTTITFSYSDGATYTASYEITVTALPEGYTQKNYICHSASGSLSLTDIKHQNGYSYKMDVAITGFQVSAGGNFFRLYKDGSNYIDVYGEGNLSTYKLKDILLRRYNRGSLDKGATITDDTLQQKGTFVLDTGNGIVKINGVDTDISTMTTGFDLTNAYLIFGYPASGYSKNWAVVQLYGIKVYDSNNVLVANLTPCTNSSNTAGLYDTVGKKFYYSSEWRTTG